MAGRKLGIVIGTNEYSDSNIRNLRFAEKDAKDVKNILLSLGICEFDKVVESINEHSTDTFGEIEQMFNEAEHNDFLLIYFSGHGELDRQNDLCLLFKNTRMDRLLVTSLNYSMIKKCISDSRCKTIIVILDCCYSGAAGVKGNNLKEILSKSSGSGTVILSASSEFDVAKEDEKLENGVFTYYLIEGLKNGAIAGDGNGYIALDDLYYYAHERTKRYSQTPYIKVDCEGKILIGKNPLKVKEQEFKRKKNKLAKIIRKELPTDIYNMSMIVLVDAYEKPEELTENDKEINNSLEYLLEGKISVKTYTHTVQCYLENEEIEDSPVLAKFREQEIPRILKDQDTPKTFTSPSTGVEFLLISAGKFMMGSPSDEQGRWDAEGPVHEVIIKNSFYMGKYPVTQKQWEKVMGSNPSSFKGEDRPVESVSWNDVQEFIKKLNEKDSTGKYRLPSESECEYACRAGITTRYSFGDDESKLGDHAWYDQNSGSETHPVGQKKSNLWGLYDMHGNVWEWCQDKWHENYNGAPSDGSAWASGSSSIRVYRGGSWGDGARSCRSASRGIVDPAFRFGALGFRVLRTL